MPYTSQKQRAWAHTPAGTEALGGPAKVHEWDVASKGKELPVYAKGKGPVSAKFAEGGPVLQATGSRFWKGGDQFTGGRMPTPQTDETPQNYDKSGKGGSLSKMEGDGKSLKPIKPRG